MLTDFSNYMRWLRMAVGLIEGEKLPPIGPKKEDYSLEDALEDFAGCAVIISHDRMFLDRLATHILSFEGDSHVEWFEGNFEDYEQDKIRRLGPESVNPKRVTYKRLTR